MALETLKGITSIGGFNIVDIDNEERIRPNNFIYVRHDKNSISFTLQNGPIKEVGVNGCQVDTMISVAGYILAGLNYENPCKENKQALEYLDLALEALEERTKDREARA